ALDTLIPGVDHVAVMGGFVHRDAGRAFQLPQRFAFFAEGEGERVTALAEGERRTRQRAEQGGRRKSRQRQARTGERGSLYPQAMTVGSPHPLPSRAPPLVRLRSPAPKLEPRATLLPPRRRCQVGTGLPATRFPDPSSRDDLALVAPAMGRPTALDATPRPSSGP